MQDEIQKQWGIVELMGHKVVAGAISKDEMCGKPMLRVDVPATSAFPAFTQFYGETAIYCVTFTSEEVATRTAEKCKINPVSVYVPDLVSMEQYDEMRKRADELQQQVYRLRRLPELQGRTCPECQSMLEENSVYCDNCGTDTPRP
jgi:hypothetical protein